MSSPSHFLVAEGQENCRDLKLVEEVRVALEAWLSCQVSNFRHYLKVEGLGTRLRSVYLLCTLIAAVPSCWWQPPS